MAFYNVSDTPPDQLDEEEVRREVDNLKRELVMIECRLAEKAAWALVEGTTSEYRTWVAKSRNFRSRLMNRYLVLRPYLRQFNLAQSGRKA